MRIEEIDDLAYDLQDNHGIFYEIYRLMDFQFSERIPTACIAFDIKSSIPIRCEINKTFWESLDNIQKRFVLCHEMSHILLRFGERVKDMSKNDISKANVAQDVCINEMLVSGFNFNRDSLGELATSGAWLDTVVWTEDKIQRHREFEYYFNRIKSGESFDEHEVIDGKALKDYLVDKLKHLNRSEVNDFVNTVDRFALGRDNAIGTKEFQAKLKQVERMDAWREFGEKHIKVLDLQFDIWHKKNRRVSGCTDLILPGTDFSETNRKKKEVWVFLDTSGSCEHLAQDLFDASESIPRKYFNVRLFGFTTHVYEIINGQMKGFGGTSFNIIEDWILKQSQGRYPHNVFVLTDGEGNRVCPKYPERWMWFLTNSYSKSYIPSNSQIYSLESLHEI